MRPFFDAETGRPLRILVVDDNIGNQKLMLHLLERLGYGADVVGSGREAVEAHKRQSYDLILMDIMMPDMDGFTAARMIRVAQPEEERLHIVAVTTNSMKADRESYLAAGMDDYVRKPIQVQDLVAALERAVGSRERHDVQRKKTADDDPHEDELGLDPVALQNLSELVGDDEAFLEELIGTYLEHAPKMIAEMKRAIAENDAPALRLTAHTLKSNSADFGAMILSELSKKLEFMGQEEQLDGAATLIPEVQSEFEKAASILRDILKQEYK